MLHCWFVIVFFLLNSLSQFTCAQYQGVVNKTKRIRRVGHNFSNYYNDYDYEDEDYYPDGGIDKRFAGGTKVKDYMKEAPFAVALLKFKPDPKPEKRTVSYQCTGSFISPRTVLIAAHCFVDNADASNYFLKYDTLTPYEEKKTSQTALISEIVIHELFKRQDYDIAVVILFAKVIHLTPDSWGYLRLPLKDQEKTFLNPKTTQIFSYGREGPKKPHALKYAPLKLYNTVPPCPSHPYYKWDFRFCSPMEGIEAISGDSGSPYVYYDGAQKKIQVAVNQGRYNYYPVKMLSISVWKVTEWILKTMKEKGTAADGSQKEAFDSWGV